MGSSWIHYPGGFSAKALWVVIVGQALVNLNIYGHLIIVCGFTAAGQKTLNRRKAVHA